METTIKSNVPHLCYLSISIPDLSSYGDKYHILTPVGYFENRTLSECDREIFDACSSLHGYPQPNFTKMKRKEENMENTLKLTYSRVNVCTKKEYFYLLTISLHFILILK